MRQRDVQARAWSAHKNAVILKQFYCVANSTIVQNKMWIECLFSKKNERKRLEFVVASLLLTIFLLNLLIRVDIWTLPKEHSFSVQVEEHWELWSEKRKEGVFFFLD